MLSQTGVFPSQPAAPKLTIAGLLREASVSSQPRPPPEKMDARVYHHGLTPSQRVSLSRTTAGLCRQAGRNEPNLCFLDFPALALYKLACCK